MVKKFKLGLKQDFFMTWVWTLVMRSFLVVQCQTLGYFIPNQGSVLICVYINDLD